MTSIESFVAYSPDNQFPIENLPYGVFSTTANGRPRIGVAIGEFVLDLSLVKQYFNGPLMKEVAEHVLRQETLNDFMGLSRAHWKETRAYLTRLLSKDEPYLRDNQKLRSEALVPQKDVQMHLPARVGDYTDFYASIDHATNVGAMFRGPGNELMPNYKHLPVGYHGRASTIVVSGTPIARPTGQMPPAPNTVAPRFGPCQRLDFELEVGIFLGGKPNKMGYPITMAEVEDHLFGLVILNDWSARDIQVWEYQPLGPFLAKNFGTTISPWIVTFEALEQFKVDNRHQDIEPLPYLENNDKFNFNIGLEVFLKPNGKKEPIKIANSNYSNLYWTAKQMLVHHSVTGCEMHPGDLLGTGTISGPEPGTYGSMLELTWSGKTPLKLEPDITRSFIEDGDEIIMKAVCQGPTYKVGFGDCSGQVIPTRFIGV